MLVSTIQNNGMKDSPSTSGAISDALRLLLEGPVLSSKVEYVKLS